MSNPIGYVDCTWNPLAMRCTPVSEACDNCWHLSMAKRLAGNPKIPQEQRAAYAGGKPIVTDRLFLHPRWRKPKRIAVQFMGDLFCESVPSNYIHKVLSAAHYSPRQTFLFLTKRPQRILDEFSDTSGGGFWTPNMWLGVTAENQARLDERVPILLQIPSAKHFVSLEPMLEAVDLIRIGGDTFGWGRVDALNGLRYVRANAMENGCEWETSPTTRLDWVILGGETGPRARPMHPDWVRSVRDQCQAARVPFWFKGWGEWHPFSDNGPLPPNCSYVGIGGTIRNGDAEADTDWCMGKIGKRVAGHLLDGREWRELPR